MRIFLRLSWVCTLLASLCFAGIDDQLITSQEVHIPEKLPLKGWLDDFSIALRKAEETNRPILIAFLGPDWCQWSDQLEADVLVDVRFQKQLEGKVILVKADLPENYDEESSKKHSSIQLKQKYGIEECPALILLKPNGEKIAQLRHLPLKSEAFAKYVQETLSDFLHIQTLAKGHKFDYLDSAELKELYVKAGSFADQTLRKALLKEGLKNDKSPYFLLEKYGDRLAKGKMDGLKSHRLKDRIAASDPENKHGALRKLAVMDFEALAYATKAHHKTDTVIRPLVEYLRTFGKTDHENAWQIEMMISQYLFGKDQIEQALEHAQASLKVAPSSAEKEINQSIEYLKTQLSQHEQAK